MLKIIVALIACWVYFMKEGFHEVSEGYVGLYKRFGVLQKKLAEPGYHFSIPLVEEFIEIKVSIQTDVVKNVPCGTSNGTLVYFDKIEVVNKLKKDMAYRTVLNYTQDYDKFWITDKIHHEINQFCSKHSLQQIYIDIFDKLDEELMKSLNKDLITWAPGIQILSVRVTKPSVPERIKNNFQKIERLKVDYFITVQKEKVRIEEELTKQKKKVIKIRSDLEVKKIDLKKKIDKKKTALKMAEIEGEMIFEKEKTKIETEFLASFEEATLYPQLYTEKFISYLAYDALTTNVTLIVGNKIPNILIDNKSKKRRSKKQLINSNKIKKEKKVVEDVITDQQNEM